MDMHLLEDGLSDCAVIRTTLETLDYFSKDDEDLRREMFGIILEAKANLIARFNIILEAVSKQGIEQQSRLEKFQTSALTLMKDGIESTRLDRMMKVNSFQEAGPHYYLRITGNNEIAALRSMSPNAFTELLMIDLIASADNEASYLDRYVFDEAVFRKYVAIMFLDYLSDEPPFYQLG